MTNSAQDLLKQALALDERDRAALAGALLESLHGELDEGSEEAWAREIRRRVSELESQAVETVPWSQVKERLFSGYE
jgi:putative addiction module component (TIGR02574 family)